jgi:hypothetical protein
MITIRLVWPVVHDISVYTIKLTNTHMRKVLSRVIHYRLDSTAVAVITGVIYRHACVNFIVWIELSLNTRL